MAAFTIKINKYCNQPLSVQKRLSKLNKMAAKSKKVKNWFETQLYPHCRKKLHFFWVNDSLRLPENVFSINKVALFVLDQVKRGVLKLLDKFVRISNGEILEIKVLF
jgi:hypothetical protein